MADDAGIINQVLTETSFLYGGNAAFVEDLYAQWAENPDRSSPRGAFFASLQERPTTLNAAADPAWTPKKVPSVRPDWLSALDGQCGRRSRPRSAPRPSCAPS
jgi:2-oxoglutarate dehydrogenase E1 component